MRPHFGEIKWIEGEFLHLLIGHYLNFQCPFGEIFSINGFYQISLSEIGVFTFPFGSFIIRKVFYSLQCFEMKFYKYNFIFCIDHTESMRAKTMHMTIPMRRSPIAHQDHHLVQTFRIQTPKVPHHSWTFTIRSRISFLGMNKI